MSKAKTLSAGLLLYRLNAGRLQVLVAHMGGPFWAKKDEGAWSIVKGEYSPDEDPFAAACREFEEETGRPAPEGPIVSLGEVRQPSGKRIVAWAVHAEFDPSTLTSNMFSMEWPPRSGRIQEFPEIDRAAWFDADTARRKLVRGQLRFIDLLEEQVQAAGRHESRTTTTSESKGPADIQTSLF